jgi:tetratricopeptide (TPR) repeat protein
MKKCLGALAIVAACAPAFAAESARAVAKAAFEVIVDHPFESDVLDLARKKIEEARATDPNEAYVWLAAGELALIEGFQGGDWTEAGSFDPDQLSRAEESFRLASAADGKLVEAYTARGRIAVIQSRFADAHHELRIAQQLAPDDFRAWFYDAECWWKQGDAAKTDVALQRARVHVQTAREQVAVNNQLERMARARGDMAEVERILKDDIRLLPSFPQVYGNYALFLLKQNRLDESIEQYERALKIGWYPAAAQQLGVARQRRQAQTQ